MRFFIDAPPESRDTLELGPEDAYHVAKVLRMAPGEHIEVCDRQENLYRCTLETVGKTGVTACIISVEALSNEPSVRVEIYAGLSKGDRFDSLIQKAVECGAAQITPFTSRRCVAVPKADDYEKKRRRFARIATEAAKQSQRTRCPEIGPIQSFEQVIAAAAEADVALFLYEKENLNGISDILAQKGDAKRFAIVTGPEGGFTDDEWALARQAGLQSVSVGPRIMRCETAPVAALCAIMFKTGNFDIGV